MVASAFSGFEKGLVQFTQDLVRIKSYSGQEESAIRLVEKKMLSLGFDEVIIDQMGNVLGKIGNGSKSILLDSHVHTVEVSDASEWKTGRTKTGFPTFAKPFF
jgi:acetylornithine deacetylase/succinyl-diaminopimelate desuccinylase-like protein